MSTIFSTAVSFQDNHRYARNIRIVKSNSQHLLQEINSEVFQIDQVWCHRSLKWSRQEDDLGWERWRHPWARRCQEGCPGYNVRFKSFIGRLTRLMRLMGSLSVFLILWTSMLETVRFSWRGNNLELISGAERCQSFKVWKSMKAYQSSNQWVWMTWFSFWTASRNGEALPRFEWTLLQHLIFILFQNE